MYFIETPPWQRLRTPPLLPLCAISLRRDEALEVEAADHVLELVDAFGLSFGFHLEAVADHDAVLAALGPAVPLFPDALAIADVGLLVAVRALAFGFAAKGACHRHHPAHGRHVRSEEHTSELQSLMRISYAVFCLKKKRKAND